jgi:hypothetical protein
MIEKNGKEGLGLCKDIVCCSYSETGVIPILKSIARKQVMMTVID